MVGAGTEACDQPHPVASGVEHLRIDMIGDGGHQYIAFAHGRDQLFARVGRVAFVEAAVEKLRHAILHYGCEGAGHDDTGGAFDAAGGKFGSAGHVPS